MRIFTVKYRLLFVGVLPRCLSLFALHFTVVTKRNQGALLKHYLEITWRIHLSLLLTSSAFDVTAVSNFAMLSATITRISLPPVSNNICQWKITTLLWENKEMAYSEPIGITMPQEHKLKSSTWPQEGHSSQRTPFSQEEDCTAFVLSKESGRDHELVNYKRSRESSSRKRCFNNRQKSPTGFRPDSQP